MCRNSIITFVLIILIDERRAFAVLMNVSVCFISGQGNNRNDTWCITELKLCGSAPAYDMLVNIKQFHSSSDNTCSQQCLDQRTDSLENYTSEVLSKCNGKSNCSLADISVPSTQHGGGILTLMFVCNNTEDGVEADNNTTTKTGNTLLPTSSSVTSTSIPTTKNSTRTTESSIISSGDGVEADNSTTINTGSTNLPTSFSVTRTSITTTKNNTRTTESSTGNNTTTAVNAQFSTGSSYPYTVTIVVSVVVPIIVVVMVVAFLMYRRGQCKQLLGKFTKKYAKHSPERTDTYAMSSEANANFTYHFSSDTDVSRSDVDYSEIDMVGQETGVEYNHVNLKKTQVAKEDPTYNHIGHLNSSPGNTEQTYNHVGDETFQNTGLLTLQPDTYSHIGAMTKPASEQLAEDSYAHINGVKQYIPEVYDINQYDCAVFQSNGGPTGHQEREMNSDKEMTFNVVCPDSNNEAPVSHSYFIVEKHEKEA